MLVSTVILQMPWAAHRTREHLIGRPIIDETLSFGIPLQLSLQHHRNVAQVTNAHRTMPNFNGRRRIPVRLDAIEEVAMMVVTLV